MATQVGSTTRNRNCGISFYLLVFPQSRRSPSFGWVILMAALQKHKVRIFASSFSRSSASIGTCMPMTRCQRTWHHSTHEDRERERSDNVWVCRRLCDGFAGFRGVAKQPSCKLRI